ncbi:MAG: DUF3124 domain-containing protein [Humidesulfovibrio sp.]|jgi:hypothetical protein|uniref:DUF3124 domain-containing protein n=1 Tax=Humidesulfovibrio sp. TaxID=2910988 RepID=UPI002735C4A1|nr:DUF3124 domain-containing protein [Humidesulfovibrio sp.]MDP2849101.1 DUF3124 domain-containing protein [Humidesulfovibrio sp.]
MKRSLIAIAACAFLTCASLPALAEMSKGQALYVPCSSHIYHGIKTRPFDLAITLTVRNTDPKRTMRLISVDYHGSDGRLLKRHVAAEMVMPPLSTREFTVEQNDTSGGAGASFLVRWRADAAMNPPVVESVMIGTANSQGISFTSRGVVIQE